MRIEVFEPSACIRISSAFWRTRPEEKAFGRAFGEDVVESAAARERGLFVWRRWDSAMRRRSSRSCARREGASSGRPAEDFEEEGWAVGLGEEV